MFGRRKAGKMLAQDRLNLEDSLESCRRKVAVLNDHYEDQLRRYEQALEKGDADQAKLMWDCAESTQRMINQAVAQYQEVYDRIDANSEISARDSGKHNASVGTAVAVGTAVGSMALGALSLAQSVETDKQGLLVHKNVKRFFENINPIQILRNHH